MWSLIDGLFTETRSLTGSENEAVHSFLTWWRVFLHFSILFLMPNGEMERDGEKDFFGKRRKTGKFIHQFVMILSRFLKASPETLIENVILNQILRCRLHFGTLVVGSHKSCSRSLVSWPGYLLIADRCGTFLIFSMDSFPFLTTPFLLFQATNFWMMCFKEAGEIHDIPDSFWLFTGWNCLVTGKKERKCRGWLFGFWKVWDFFLYDKLSEVNREVCCRFSRDREKNNIKWQIATVFPFLSKPTCDYFHVSFLSEWLTRSKCCESREKDFLFLKFADETGES